MPIKIEWVDPNDEGAAVNIHRSLTPMLDEANLPAPIGTVSDGSKFYMDNNVVRNQLYYYRLSSLGKAGSSELVITPNKAMAHMPYTGPGPQSIIRGNWECGYFGRMPINSLIAQSEMMSLITAGGSPVENVTTDNEWHKFVYKGKIIFFPKYPLCGTIAWDMIYKSGLVYGDIPDTEWPAWVKTTYGIITQKKKINVGSHEFTVRNPTSRTNPLSTGTTVVDQTGGEYDQFMSLVGRLRLYADPAGRNQVDDVDYPAFVSMTTDVNPGGTQINRGWSNAIDALNVTLANTGTHAQHGWRPLLILTL